MKNDNKTFIKSISILTAGSAISIFFLAIQHLILPYIFSAEELGTKSVIMAIPISCIAIMCGRYDLTLVYEEDEKQIYPLLKLNLILTFLLSILLTILCFFYFIFIAKGYIRYWYTLPFICFFLMAYGLTLILDSYNNRYREYKIISKMHALRSAAQSIGTIFLGFVFVYLLKITSLNVAILVIPYCLGRGCGLFSQGKELIQHRKEIMNIDIASVKAIAKKHIKQPLFSAQAIFANSFSYSLITIMINALFGEKITGYYSLSISLLGLPIALISGNMSKVYMRDASVEYAQTGGYIKAFKKNLVVLVGLTIPMFFFMFFVAPLMCTYIFGYKWEPAGQYIKALALMFSFRFVSTALSPGLYVCRKQIAELLIQISFLLVTAMTGLVAYMLKLNPLSFMWFLGATRSVVMLMLILAVYHYSKKGLRNLM